ncbi:MAG TPA: transposase [Chloroflexia bacterium]|nr:transposase [Chloroflexia bacterium]
MSSLVQVASLPFPPQLPDHQAAHDALLYLVRQDPHLYDQHTTRWTLATIRIACSKVGWLRLASLSLPGVWQLLHRLGIVWKHARQYIHSPDPYYFEKLSDVKAARQQARANPEDVVLLFMDQVTVWLQPTVAYAYEQRGHYQPLARLSPHSNSQTRVVGSLDSLTAQVVYLRGRVSTSQLVRFYQKVCAAYPQARRIYVVLDNWPVHVHPDVLVALEEQHSPWVELMKQRVPANWPKEPSMAARRKWGELQLPIQLVPLPTYASWSNPIEKLWRKMRQEKLHMHWLAGDLSALRSCIDSFLDQFKEGSPELLRYVGLAQPST